MAPFGYEIAHLGYEIALFAYEMAHFGYQIAPLAGGAISYRKGAISYAKGAISYLRPKGTSSGAYVCKRCESHFREWGGERACSASLAQRALFVHRGVASSAASVVALPLPRRVAMDDYPKKEHVRGREMRCHFHDCGKDFAHFRSLVAHLRTRHGVAKDELAGHWVHAEYLRERRSAAVLGVREAEFVSIALDDEGVVNEKLCVCIPCAKVIGKVSCAKHMVNVHSLPQEVVSKWCARKDGDLLKRKRARAYEEAHLCFTRAWSASRMSAAAAETGGEQEQEVAMDDDDEAEVEDQDESAEEALVGEGRLPQQPLGVAGVVSEDGGPLSPGKFAQPTAKYAPRALQDTAQSRAAANVAPAGAASTEASALSQTLLGQIASALGRALSSGASSSGSQLEEAAPRVKFTPEALAWNVGAESEDGRRSSWPLLPNREVPLQKFFVYLVNAKGLEDNSAQGHLLRMTYFFGMFDLPTEFSQEGFMAALFSSGVAEQWAALPIMSPERPATRNMMTAVLHYVDFLILNCERRQHREACRCLTLLKADVLKPLCRRTLKARAIDENRLREEDGEKLRKLPKPEVLREAVREAMIDLHHVWEECRARGATTLYNKGIANTIMIGLVFCNSYAGRPGEWARLRRCQVEEMINNKQTLLTFKRHKTAWKYGSLGRHVPPGNRAAMAKMLDIHPATAELFFDPPRLETKVVQCGALLTRFSAVYTPEYQPCQATLMRKLFHSKAVEDRTADRVLKELCEADKHSLWVGKHNYVAANAAQDARRTAAVFRAVLGDPVNWPTPEELSAGKERSIARLQQWVSRLRRVGVAETESCGAEQSDGGDDDDEEDEDDEPSEEGEQRPEQGDEREAAEGVDARATRSKRKRIGEGRQDAKVDGEKEEVEEEQMAEGQRAQGSGGAKKGEQTEGGKAADVQARGAQKAQLSEKHKLYIMTHCELLGCGVPSVAVMKDMLAQGAKNGSLPEGCTLEQVQGVCRKWSKER